MTILDDIAKKKMLTEEDLREIESEFDPKHIVHRLTAELRKSGYEWRTEVARLVAVTGASIEAARRFADGELAYNAMTSGQTPREFYEDVRWLMSHFKTEDGLLQAIELKSDEAFRSLESAGRR